MSRELVVIQASCNGESIKNRSFLEIKNSISVIDYLISRVKPFSDRIVIATSNLPVDDGYEEVAARNNIAIFRGDSNDIPRRLVECAEKYGDSSFIRLYANQPFVDIDLMADLYMEHMMGKFQYSYNEHLHGVLWGMGCDIFDAEFLRKLSDMELNESQKQTIGAFIRQNSDAYRLYEYTYCDKRPGYKLNLESKRDLEVIKEIANSVSEINCRNVVEYMDSHPILAKYNLEGPPKEVGVEKLFFSLGKIDSILNHNVPDPTYPVSVELTLTNACNMNCVYCSDAMLRAKQGMTEQISLNDFKRLFDDLARGGTKGIVLEGGGEPTLYSHFDEVVTYAKDAGLAVGLITNGSKRLKREILERFEWIRVSLDASTPAEYKAVKQVDFYETVIDNIAYYTKYCPTVGVGYVVTSENISQIEPLVMRLRELKVSYIQLRPVVDCEEIYPKGVDLSYLKFYMTKEFGVQVDGMVENAYSGNHGLPCYANSITSIISGDGSVYICGRLNIYDWLKPIGNIRKQSFSEIWNGEERRKQTDMISNAEFCHRNCPQCRVSKFNVLFDKLYGIKSRHFI